MNGARTARPAIDPRCIQAFVGAAAFWLLPGLAQALPVIPGQTGFGIETPAGRGGTVYRVTNLNASGPGSLAACVVASGPRVCVFEVSGVIKWTDDLTISNPYITIAGQTAPSPGIMIRGGALWVSTHDVLIQHITMRVGDDAVGPNPSYRKSLKISTEPSAVYNVVVDHCSFSWGVDETVNPGWADFDNITFNNSIVSEGLNNNVFLDWSGYGMIIGGMPGKARISMIGNLFAHNWERNPFSYAQGFIFVNNVIYNSGASAVVLSGGTGSGMAASTTSSSIVGNVFIRGADTGRPYLTTDYVGIHQNAVDGSRVYLSDNAVLSSYSSPQVPLTDQWSRVSFGTGKTAANFRVSSPPIWLSDLKPLPVGNVRDKVLSNVGSRPADRSARDKKIVNDVLSGSGNIVNCVSAGNCRAAPYNKDAGGWPNYAQNVRPLTLPANPSGDDNRNGYTNLEEWLLEMARQVEVAGAVPEPPKDITVQ